MKIWLTTDTHFGHSKMVELCNRPPDFTERIHRNLLRNLQRDDLLIHLGDVCIGKDAEMHERYIQTLPCRRALVKGNHDRKSDHWYLTNGWHFVCDQFVMTFQGKRILFSHVPVADEGNYDLNIHGHFHNTNHRCHEPELVAIKNEKQRLLALEYTNYQPVLLKSFVEQLNRAR